MKIKTSELTGKALDWAVAKCECNRWEIDWRGVYLADYSTDWAQGGSIIEREGINIRAIRKNGHSMDGQWLAAYDAGNTSSMVQWVKREDYPKHYFTGQTPLIAAMRCFVANKLGDEVEMPKEFTK